MRQARPREIITERSINKKASKQSKRKNYWRSYRDISFSLLDFTLYSCYYYFLNMADAKNETHSCNLPVLQPLPLTHFVNEKACSSQKQQERPDLQTCVSNSFQLFADTLMSKFKNLSNKIVEKSLSRANAKGKRIRR